MIDGPTTPGAARHGRRAADPYPMAFVGLTDWDWFDRLRSIPDLDEVNFWQPSPGGGFAALRPGEPFIFKLHRPRDLIVGCAFFAHYSRLPVSLAWDAFRTKNGTASLAEMRTRVQRYRRTPSSGPEDYEIGCVVWEQPLFLDERDWIEAPEWKPNIQRGRTYRLDTEPGLTMWRALEVRLGASPLPIESVDRLLREPGAARYGSPMFVLPRLGQGSFQVAVVDAYRRRCAVTGEKVLPVLESAHIKPYADGGEHRVDNGMLLRSDIHKLFDRGYLTVTPGLEIVVSKRLRDDFDNGDDYLAMSGARIQAPLHSAQHPSAEFLAWHNANRYVG